jgi:sugar phosphate isomerase/epimerase
MIKSAVTISLVPEARGGPFVFWDDLPAACRAAAELGFDAVEVFAPDARSLGSALRRLLDDHGLKLAAAGTGAGWLIHKLTLTSPDPTVRQRAKDFIHSIIDAAGALGAPAIIGSMQGRWAGEVTRDDALSHLEAALFELEDAAAAHHVRLLYEPLNRYETNLFNSVVEASSFVKAVQFKDVMVLADLYHMNIEEEDLREALIVARPRLGHVHFADSNRRPAGCGHTNFEPIASALEYIGYGGHVSAECLPYPNPDGAAKLTIDAFRKYFRN